MIRFIAKKLVAGGQREALSCEQKHTLRTGETVRRACLAPSGVEINPRFYRGKKNSFSMRLSEGKQILESKHLSEKEMLKE